jgi:hypothetical protein
MGARPGRVVAVQVEFERHILKPYFHLIGAGLKPSAFQLWGGGVNVTAPPRHRALLVQSAVRRRVAGRHDVAVQVAFER